MAKAIKKGTGKRTTKPLQWDFAKSCLEDRKQNEDWHGLLILAVGFYSGFRISDMLSLTYADFEGKYLDISERKTTKQRKVTIIKELRAIVELCRKQLKKKKDNYLFVRARFRTNTPITRQAAIERIRQTLKSCGRKERNLTAHTLRKTFALQYYNLARKEVGDQRALIMLSKQLNHSSIEITMRYIGIDEIVEKDIFENWN